MSLFSKFPSFHDLLRDAAKTFKRFPASLICALILTCILVWMAEEKGQNIDGKLMRVAMVAGLGISLQIALKTWSERYRQGAVARYIVQAAGMALLVAYYFSLPANPMIAEMYMIRLAILGIFLHCLVSFSPFLGKGRLTGFWQYNKSLFLRGLFSALYSAVLYIGLAIALLAAKELFGLNVPEERFLQLWIVIAVAFNTWVFLAGIPEDLEALNQSDMYPKGLKVFAQYILLPLVGLYLIILYAYELKIIINWNWPKGWVSQLVLWFSVVGILSMLLLWPQREQTENRWIRNYIKWFFRALIPLVVMLFLAITERIGDYGITINRYLVIALASGLALVTIYFVLSRKKDIRLIPIILCIIALFSAYGPWNAFAVARHSQQTRLEKLLVANGIYSNGAITAATKEIPPEQNQEMSSIVSYLAQNHGVMAFSRWLPDSSLKTLDTLQNGWAAGDSVAAMLGFQYAHQWGNGTDRFSYNLSDSSMIAINNYSSLAHFEGYSSDDTSHRSVYILGNDTCSIWLKKHPPILNLEFSSPSNGKMAPLKYDMTEMLTFLANAMYDTSLAHLQAPEFTVGDYDLKIVTKDFHGNRIKDTVEVYSYNAYLLFRKKAL